jgi:hypothetical protein
MLGGSLASTFPEKAAEKETKRNARVIPIFFSFDHVGLLAASPT